MRTLRRAQPGFAAHGLQCLRLVGEESEQLHLSDLWSFAQQSFAFSRVVRFEEEVEKEAPVFGSERVAAAWLASHQARRGLWSWSSGSPCLRQERARCLTDQLRQLQDARLPLREPRVQQGPRAEWVLGRELLLGQVYGRALGDAETYAPQTRPAVVISHPSRCIACPVSSLHQL